MTLSIDELFEIVTKTIAEPNTTITEQDKRKAIRLFLGFDDYLIDALPGYYNGYNNADLNINFNPDLLFHI
jgi:hypothetical protein